jgi:hypothetical protein
MSDPDHDGCAADGHVLTRAFPPRSYFGPGDRADGCLTRRDQIVTVGAGSLDVELSGHGEEERLAGPSTRSATKVPQSSDADRQWRHMSVCTRRSSAGSATVQMWSAADPRTFPEMEITMERAGDAGLHRRVLLSGTAQR